MTNLTYTHPRTYGKDSKHCRACATTRGVISKYGLNMCRRCFRERATQIGFVKENIDAICVLCSTVKAAPNRMMVGSLAIRVCPRMSSDAAVLRTKGHPNKSYDYLH
ncbi:hypothetical protein Ae201684_003678 [Aphanomyces euteiches]|uniref:40S ribosomal protein S29 n=1 Tax=Aphanomyces euteiches TaxID=100861 RepID=A0A6G0XLG1_9STRA|nr:hypothetical protein Ae201684_003678 [Aphanomyces euteiches]